MIRTFQKACLTMILLNAILGFAARASAQVQETVLYRFQGDSDGDGPVGSVVLDKAGNIFGATTYTLGCITSFQCGAVYELSPPQQPGDPWTETSLYDFQGNDSGDAGAPGGGLIQDAEGNLYGSTSYGGGGPCILLGTPVGCGVVYELIRPVQPGGAWTEKILYRFQGGEDGQFPIGDLVFDERGNLYGVTWFGGGKGDSNTCNALYPYCGTVFELTPPRTTGPDVWTEKVLYSFQGLDYGDGGQPNGGLVFDRAGNIYGTTWVGGTSGNNCKYGCGTVYKLTPPTQQSGVWTEIILHLFSNYPKDGSAPNGNLILSYGALLGTTQGGGKSEEGTVYALRPDQNGSWTETFLYVFTQGQDGASPTALVVGPHRSLYGTAGGSPTRGGLIFRIEPPSQKGMNWSFTTLYDFIGSPDGYGPITLRLADANTIFGATLSGGDENCVRGGCGTVFQLTH